MALAENLILLRRVRGLTQKQMAEIAHVSRQTYVKWEKGESVPDIEQCEKLAGFYEIKIDRMLHYAEKIKDLKETAFQEGTFRYEIAKIGNRGQVILPEGARESYQWKEGDSVILLGRQEGIFLMNVEVFEKKMREEDQNG